MHQRKAASRWIPGGCVVADELIAPSEHEDQAVGGSPYAAWTRALQRSDHGSLSKQEKLMTERLDDVLDDCLNRTLFKGHAMEECLATYPQ